MVSQRTRHKQGIAGEQVAARDPLEVVRRTKAGSYQLSFRPDEVPALSVAVSRRRQVNGYTLEAVMLHLAERGDPAWASALDFDSEPGEFVVRCARRLPLVFLVRRFQKRLADAKAMRRLVRGTPARMFEGALGR